MPINAVLLGVFIIISSLRWLQQAPAVTSLICPNAVEGNPVSGYLNVSAFGKYVFNFVAVTTSA